MQTAETKKTEKFFCSEMELQELWNRLPNGSILTLPDGSRMTVLSHGEWNHEAGPDFRNAKIRIAGKVRTGDIELHLKSSDFIRHGHLADSAYDRIILHVVLEDDLDERERPARLELPHYVIHDSFFRKLVSGQIPSCRLFPFMNEWQLTTFFQDAGEERLREKSRRILESMIVSGTEYGFAEALFNAAGYKRNSKPFHELFERFEQYPPGIRRTHFESILWGESSLLPDPASGELPPENVPEIKRLWEDFWQIRREASGEISWFHDSVRPQNTPERRIAFLCTFFRISGTEPFASMIGNLRNMSPEDYAASLRKQLVCRDDFWDVRITFRHSPAGKPAAILGGERLLNILTDVFAPSFLAFAQLQKDAQLEERAKAFYRSLPAPSSNSIQKLAENRWFAGNPPEKLFRTGATAQGCLHIYKTYCAGVSGDCSVCPLAPGETP